MATFHELSTAQLRQALQLREQIDSLQQKLDAMLGDAGSASPQKSAVGRPAGKRTMSVAARAKIAAAARARWAKVKGTAGPAKAAAVPAKKGGLTPQGRAKLAAAMKARWAAKKKGASTRPAK